MQEQHPVLHCHCTLRSNEGGVEWEICTPVLHRGEWWQVWHNYCVTGNFLLQMLFCGVCQWSDTFPHCGLFTTAADMYLSIYCWGVPFFLLKFATPSRHATLRTFWNVFLHTCLIDECYHSLNAYLNFYGRCMCCCGHVPATCSWHLLRSAKKTSNNSLLVACERLYVLHAESSNRELCSYTGVCFNVHWVVQWTKLMLFSLQYT